MLYQVSSCWICSQEGVETSEFYCEVVYCISTYLHFYIHIYISTYLQYLHIYISTYLHIYISTHPRVQVRYCGQECRDRHLPPDHEEPWPVVAKYRPGVGRLLVAARDIDPGELIFTED